MSHLVTDIQLIIDPVVSTILAAARPITIDELKVLS